MRLNVILDEPKIFLRTMSEQFKAACFFFAFLNRRQQQFLRYMHLRFRSAALGRLHGDDTFDKLLPMFSMILS